MYFFQIFFVTAVSVSVCDVFDQIFCVLDLWAIIGGFLLTSEVAYLGKKDFCILFICVLRDMVCRKSSLVTGSLNGIKAVHSHAFQKNY